MQPPPVKRQFRDPYGDWWDKQERRNFGEPIHEDEDVLGMFSPYEYTHTTSARAVFQIGCFIATIFSLAVVVSYVYPDKPSVPRTFPGGLDVELGGPGAVRVSLSHLTSVLLQRCFHTLHNLALVNLLNGER